MAGNKLADILVTLSLNTKDFYKELRQAGNKVQAMGKQMERANASMASSADTAFENITSGSRDVGNTMSDMASQTQGSFNQMARQMGMTQREFKKFAKEGGMFTQSFAADIDSLPPHLKDLSRNLTETRNTIREMATDATHSAEDMAKAFAKTNVGDGGLNKITTNGKNAIKTMQDLQAESKKTQLAVMGLNETGTGTISTEESQKQMEAFQKKVYQARAEMEKLKKSGDFGTYNAAMQNLEFEMGRVQSAMNATAVGGSALQRTLKSLGIVTSDMGNEMAMRMERMRGSIMAANAQFNAMDTQAKKASSMLQETGGKAYFLSHQFLKVADGMEMAARKGNAFNLALKQLGNDAPLANIVKRVGDINKGLGRMTQLQMYGGLAAAGMVYGLVLMSNEIDGRLIPAFNNLKGTWADALTPFIQAFTTAGVAVLNFITKIGELAAKFAEVHPQLSQMAWGFLAIFIALVPLLAPLAIAIGLTDGLAAAFALLWGMIAPFVTGFAIVAGIAALVAAAIVVLVAVFHNMWQASENLRTSFANLWAKLVEGVTTALAPLKQKWDELKQSFFDLMAVFTGGQANSMVSFWQLLGDKVAMVVNWITANLLPILVSGVQLFAQGVSMAIDGVIMVFGWLAQQWQAHGAQIKGVLSTIWSAVQSAFSAIAAFIQSKMPQIKQIVKDAMDAVKTAFDFAMTHIVPKVQQAFTFIWNIIQKVMPIVLMLIRSTWDNIKNVISSALNIIQNVIQLFSNVLKGNWKGAWENVKNIVKNAVKLVWNLIQLWFAGKILKVFSLFKGKAVTLIKSAFEKISSGIKSKVSSIQSTVSSKFNSIKDKMLKPVNQAKDKIKQAVDKIKGFFSKMKLKIPKPHIPKISVTWATMGKGKFSVKVPKIHWNAKGGIFDGASILGGNQGVGEAGAEAVMPIQHKRYMKPFASAVAENIKDITGTKTEKSSSGDQYIIEFRQPVYIREEADIAKIVAEMDKKKRIAERAKGTFSYKK